MLSKTEARKRIPVIIRWDAQNMPIPVAVNVSSNASVKQQDVTQAVQFFRKALQAWQDASLGLIFLQESAQPITDGIHLHLNFTSGPTSSQCFRTIKKSGIIQNAKINISLNQDTPLSPTEMTRIYRLFLHEIGHALGLEHSKNPKDTMSIQPGADTLSLDDMCTLLWNYRLPAGLSLDYIASQNGVHLPETLFDLLPTLDRWFWNLTGGDQAMKNGFSGPTDTSALLYQQALAMRKPKFQFTTPRTVGA